MGINIIAKWFGIVGAIAFFCLSTIRLIAFALSQEAISISENKLFEFIYKNYLTLNITFISIILTSTIFICISYFIWSSKKRQIFIKYLALLLIISSLVWATFELSLFLAWLKHFSLSKTFSNSFLSLTFILFGIAIFLYKNNRKTTLMVLSPLYILQGILFFLSLFTTVQLAEFTIAIKITEAIFFSQQI